jgi:FlaG/FlaF family flagellin (archaellin)
MATEQIDAPAPAAPPVHGPHRWLIIALIIALTLTVAALIAASLALSRAQTANSQIPQLRTELSQDSARLAAEENSIASVRRNAVSTHLGLCFQQSFDNSTGDVLYTTLTTPTNSGGVPACPTGSFVSVVPGVGDGNGQG